MGTSQALTARDRVPAPIAGTTVESLFAEFEEPFTVEVDATRREVFVKDRGMAIQYELCRRRAFGVGWAERVFGEKGCVTETAVRTGEVMAVVREAGRDEEVAAITEAAAETLTEEDGCNPTLQRRRLHAEVAAGRGLDLLALRPIQIAILERIEAGDTITFMCERGGFGGLIRKADTSWLLRRAGLIPQTCSKSGKVRYSRVARYDVFVKLVKAVDRDPVEFGV